MEPNCTFSNSQDDFSTATRIFLNSYPEKWASDILPLSPVNDLFTNSFKSSVENNNASDGSNKEIVPVIDSHMVFTKDKQFTYKEPVKDEFSQSINANCSSNEFQKAELNQPQDSGSINTLPFECSICKRKYPTKRKLTIHSQTHKKKEKKYKCDKCDKAFLKRCHLTNHYRMHTGETPFACNICGFKFRLSCSLKSHNERYHNEGNKFKCDVCEKTYYHQGSLKNHLLTHTSLKNFSCDFCSRNFAEKCHLTVHRRIHTGEKPYSCPLCERKYKTSYEMKLHMRIKHTLEKRFSCETCPEKFMHKSQLIRHMMQCSKDSDSNQMNVSTTVVPAEVYGCNFCTETFSSKDSFLEHLYRTHKCETCHQEFDCPNELQAHYEKWHRYICDACDEIFLYKYMLNHHRRQYHEFKCNICGKTFVSQNLLQGHHNLFHNFKCRICGKIFATKHVLHVHKRHFHEHKCNTCGRIFISEDLLQAHNNTSHNFNCRACSKIFVSKYALDEHFCSFRQLFENYKNLCTNNTVQSAIHLEKKCNYPKSFTANFDLQTYSNKRATDKPFVFSDVNPKPFKANLEMKMYLCKYSKEKNLACGLCKKKFNYYCMYKVHSLMYCTKHKHQNYLKQHKCNMCEKIFHLRASLISHRKLHITRNEKICNF